MGGSTDAFALYLSLFRVDRPADASKPSTSLAFHKEAESKFEFGTATLKTKNESAPQEELMSYEEMKEKLDREKEESKVNLETEDVPANPTARNGRVLGGEGEELTMGQRREMAVRAAEKRAQAEKEREGLKAGEVRDVQIRAQPAA